MNVGEWLSEATEKLEQNNNATARLDALLLLEYVLNSPRAIVLAHADMALPATTLVKLNDALKQRLDGIPIAYLLHKKEFYGRDFIVNEHVLIPRPETENIIDIVKNISLATPRILDVGTGSGCIAITLALELPKCKVVATDISDDVLKLANQNAKNLGAQVTLKKSDLLKDIDTAKFHILCANLPYVPDGLVTSKEITNEPKLALFSGEDGLDHYKKLFEQLNNLTVKPRFVITESLEKQHSSLIKLAKKADYSLQKTDNLVQLFKKI
jgi:release factor glutamine methyltransferase